jgi:hypothetical protein
MCDIPRHEEPYRPREETENQVSRDKNKPLTPAGKAKRAKAKAIPIASTSCLVPDEVLNAPGADAELLKVQDAIDKTAMLGKSLKETCRLVGINYARAYVLINANPPLVKRWNQARVDYLRFKVEDMERIANTEPDVQRARLLCDNIKWEAQRVARHIYGDHIIVAGDADAPLITKLVMGSAELVRRIRQGDKEDGDGS